MTRAFVKMCLLAMVLSCLLSVKPASAHGWHVTYLEWDGKGGGSTGPINVSWVKVTDDDPLHAAAGYIWAAGQLQGVTSTPTYSGGGNGYLQVEYEWSELGSPGDWHVIATADYTVSMGGSGSGNGFVYAMGPNMSPWIAASTPDPPAQASDQDVTVPIYNFGATTMSGTYGNVSAGMSMWLNSNGLGTVTGDSLVAITYETVED